MKKLVLKRSIRRKIRKAIIIAKPILSVLVIILAIVMVKDRIEIVKANNEAAEKQLVENYVSCLKDNWTQRDYCSRQVSDTDYRILDQKIEKYGYTYKQVGYDLYIVEK